MEGSKIKENLVKQGLKIAAPIVAVGVALGADKTAEAQIPTPSPVIGEPAIQTPRPETPTPSIVIGDPWTATPDPDRPLNSTPTPTPVIGEPATQTPRPETPTPSIVIGEPWTATPDPDRPLGSTPTKSAVETQGAQKTPASLPQAGGNSSEDKNPLDTATALAAGATLLGGAAVVDVSRRFAKKK